MIGEKSVWEKTCILKTVHHGEVVPAGYGVFYHSFMMNCFYATIVPFHAIAWLVTWVWSNLRWLHKGIPTSPKQAYDQGFSAARKKYIGGLNR